MAKKKKSATKDKAGRQTDKAKKRELTKKAAKQRAREAEKLAKQEGAGAQEGRPAEGGEGRTGREAEGGRAARRRAVGQGGQVRRQDGRIGRPVGQAAEGRPSRRPVRRADLRTGRGADGSGVAVPDRRPRAAARGGRGCLAADRDPGGRPGRRARVRRHQRVSRQFIDRQCGPDLGDGTRSGRTDQTVADCRAGTGTGDRSHAPPHPAPASGPPPELVPGWCRRRAEGRAGRHPGRALPAGAGARPARSLHDDPGRTRGGDRQGRRLNHRSGQRSWPTIRTVWATVRCGR